MYLAIVTENGEAYPQKINDDYGYIAAFVRVRVRILVQQGFHTHYEFGSDSPPEFNGKPVYKKLREFRLHRPDGFLGKQQFVVWTIWKVN